MDSGDSGELAIDVDGHQYVEQENYSSVDGGPLDSYEMQTPDGSLVFTDEDHDGKADEVTAYGSTGHELGHADYDPETGQWTDTSTGEVVASGGGSTDDTAASDHVGSHVGGHVDGHVDGHVGGTGVGGDGREITVDTAHGEVSGPATVDALNRDGTPDTAVARDSDGDTIFYTDVDGDSHADVATEVDANGHVVIAEYDGDHQWSEVETGHVDSHGDYHSDGAASSPFDPPTPDYSSR